MNYAGPDEVTYSIPAEEAHKAYYLFTEDPEAKTIFSTGLAIQGKDIKRIVPDYHGTMGWNKSHKLDDNDWNELNAKDVVRKLASIQAKAALVAKLENPQLDKPLPEAVKALPRLAHSKEVEKLASKMKA